jgi:hypothetical protein
VASRSNSSNRWSASSGPRSPERKRSPIILYSSKRERRPAAGQLGMLSAPDTAGGGDGPGIGGSNSALSWSTSSRPRLPDGTRSPAAHFRFSHGWVLAGPNRRDMSSDLLRVAQLAASRPWRWRRRGGGRRFLWALGDPAFWGRGIRTAGELWGWSLEDVKVRLDGD